MTVEGSVSFILRPESAGLILHAALGEKNLRQVGETDAYTHTIALCDVQEHFPA